MRFLQFECDVHAISSYEFLSIHFSYKPSCPCTQEEKDDSDCNIYYECLIIEVILDKSGPPLTDVYYEESNKYNLTDRDKLVQAIARAANVTKTLGKQNDEENSSTLVLYEDESIAAGSIHFMPNLTSQVLQGPEVPVPHALECFGMSNKLI